MLTHIDLFSGQGGFALAAQWLGIETKQFVEIEPFAQKVLRKNFPSIPIHSDIKTYDATGIVSPFILTGGYPCQPFSQAGLRKGAADDRHLWPEMLRVITECRPNWVLGENVAGHITMGLDQVLTDLENEGYSCRAFAIPAVGLNAPHKRERVWTTAHTNNPRQSTGERTRQNDWDYERNDTGRICQNVAYAQSERIQGCGSSREQKPPAHDQKEIFMCSSEGHQTTYGEAESRLGGTLPYGIPGWMDEPDIPRVTTENNERVNRIKSNGNAIVPQIAYMIMRGMILCS
mgnify:CR=1 FL=1